VQDREITPSGVRYDANSVDECYGDEASLVPGAPLDGSIPGLELVRAFEDRIVEKLWVFNADHATAAYLGWHAGCETIDEAMTHEGIRAAVSVVVRSATIPRSLPLRASRLRADTNPPVQLDTRPLRRPRAGRRCCARRPRSPAQAGRR
jgi:hypothetical protein